MTRIGWIAAVIAASIPTTAQANELGYEFGLSQQLPGKPSVMTLRVTYGAADSKPPALDQAYFDLPAGTRVDTTAVPRCAATDEELQLLGRGACPPESRVGSGRVVAVTGLPGLDPVEADATVFNGENELIELVTFKGTDVTAGWDRLTVDGARLTAHPPATPGGPPDFRTTIREVALTIDKLATTPPTCTPGGWTSRATVLYAGATAPVTATSTTPCTAPAVKRKKKLKGSRARCRRQQTKPPRSRSKRVRCRERR